jgi:hypothetical protein
MSNDVIEKIEDQSDAMDIYGMGGNRALTPEMIKALQTLNTGEIPPEAVQERPGKGGQVFKYVEHTWLSRQLREGLGMWWSYDVQSAQLMDDGTAMAIVTLRIHMPLKDGTMFTNSLTEVGVWEDQSGRMPHAMRIASAVSRGLARCAMRRFGIGEEFYSNENVMTVKEAYDSLKRFAEKRGMEAEDFDVLLVDEMEISRENLVDKYMTVWREIIRQTEE